MDAEIRNTWRSFMRKLAKFLCVAALALPMIGEAQVYVHPAPPPIRREVVPVTPYAGGVWIPGRWRWNGRAYIWVGGYYRHAPRPAAVWIPGHWAQRPGGWVWVNGHWRY
jgi:WXXGXW repeat (2 copies)